MNDTMKGDHREQLPRNPSNFHLLFNVHNLILAVNFVPFVNLSCGLQLLGGS